MKKLTALLLIFLVIFSLAGCESMPAEQSAEEMLLAIKAKDTEALVKYVDNFVFYEPELNDTLTEAMYLNSGYTIGEVKEIDSKNKTVEITLKNLNINEILAAAEGKIAMVGFDEKNIDSDKHTADIIKIYSDVLSGNSDNFIESKITVDFTKKTGNWIAQFDENSSKEFMKAFFGGYEF